MTTDALVFYIIEHPTKGVLMSMDETDAGKVGRFSPTRKRSEALRYPDANACANARKRITAADPYDCVIMKRDEDRLFTRVLLGPVEEPRNA